MDAWPQIEKGMLHGQCGAVVPAEILVAMYDNTEEHTPSLYVLSEDGRKTWFMSTKRVPA